MTSIPFNSFWHHTTHRALVPSSVSHVPEKADLVIVGAGIFGLCTAIEVARCAPHLGIVVLEKTYPGAGSTGRSGGIIYVNGDYLPGSESNFRAFSAWLQRFGLNRLMTFGPSKSPNGEFEYPAHLMNPQVLADQLSIVAQSLGVHLVTGSPVRAITPDVDRIRLKTHRNDLLTKIVVLAAGTHFAPELFPDSPLSVEIEHCVAVEVAPSSDLPWNFAKVTNPTTDDFVWGRTLSSRMFLFGNRAGDCSRGTMLECTLQSLAKNLPYVRVTRPITHWIGLIDRFHQSNKWQTFELEEGGCRIYFAGGFNGQGLLGGFTAALDVTRRILDT
ncbi:NAD(P)/FAD-dependent oxidoreductase [Rhizobium laguerreae]|uniref:NAD(P)/FAD-dependent oxidoreductase n=1 Tax=Rhizobium laguerreae TaxID=1076926 RepID=UPI001C900BBF|nr:FAD-dependent oxidoreductase [Rhizobium laguerreae]MBY3220947.1 FAD-dependent oxidoreductase [Rhizobium laguerreae]